MRITHLIILLINLESVHLAPKKNLGLLLDKRVNFNEHIQRKVNKCYRIIGVIKRLSSDPPRMHW